MTGCKWLAQSTMYRQTVDLVGVMHPWGDSQTMGVLQPVTFEIKTQPERNIIEAPTMALSPESAKSLLQALWDAGLRPEKYTADNGPHVTAMQGHIKFAERIADGLMQQLGKSAP